MVKPTETVVSDAQDIIDLDTLDTVAASDAGATIELTHPVTKEPIGINIKVLGKHSETFRELVRDRSNKRIKMESFASRRGKPTLPRTAEQVEAEALNMLVACTTGWESGKLDKEGKLLDAKPVIKMGGQEYPFTPANALTIYTKFLWMREQVDEGIGDLENFIKA